jgi:hypothetical protein
VAVITLPFALLPESPLVPTAELPLAPTAELPLVPLGKPLLTLLPALPPKFVPEELGHGL